MDDSVILDEKKIGKNPKKSDIEIGDKIDDGNNNNIYTVIEELGIGVYAKVYKVSKKSQKSNHETEFAMKVLETRYAREELNILEKVRGCGSIIEVHHEVELDNEFTAILMPILGPSLLDVMESNSPDFDRCFKVEDIKVISLQIAEALSFLCDRSIVHLDLKPENILFVSQKPMKGFHEKSSQLAEIEFVNDECRRIKLIDFNVAQLDYSEKSMLDRARECPLQSRNYRAPEAFLKIGYDERADVWSLACLMIEMYEGRLLFDTECEETHVSQFIKLFGRLPPRLINEAKTIWNDGVMSFFDYSALKLRIVNSRSCRRINMRIRSGDVEAVPMFQALNKMFALDPKMRPTPDQVLKLPFFSEHQ